MANIFFDGTLGQVSGSTEFGIYDNDVQFTSDAPRVALWCARRLGYPVIDLELQDVHFYTCFEEAINEYGALVNEQNIQDNLYNVKGMSSNFDINNSNVKYSSRNLFDVSKEYGRSVLGSNSEYSVRTGSIELTAGRQTYNLNALFRDIEHPGEKLIIRKLYHTRRPAVTRFFDPYSTTGIGTQNIYTEFGFDNLSPSSQFVLMPLHEDLLRIQAIEFNDTIRKSAYSFRLDGNELRIFPIPQVNQNLFFEYQLQSEVDATAIANFDSGSVITDASNVPYDELTYSNINNVGKQWIKKYTLACVKETLGIIRSKFANIPIPDGDVSLDGDTLRNEAATEKQNLITEMREVLEKTGMRNQMEARREISESTQEQLKKFPKLIYVR